MNVIFKIVPKKLWDDAVEIGGFEGAPIDKADGYIHFSTKEQVRETAAKHFAGQKDLLLVALDADDFGELLRWEPSRGGDLFPHLYATFNPSRAIWVRDLPLDSDGNHVFPEVGV